MSEASTVSDSMIEALRREAREAGDALQVCICTLALGEEELDGDHSASRLAQVIDTYPVLDLEDCRRLAAHTEESARDECVRVIRAARAVR